MDSNVFFWQVQAGKLPPPQAAQTLGMTTLHVDAESGALEAEFEGKPEFTNPGGSIQGGFLSGACDWRACRCMHPTLVTVRNRLNS